MFQLLRKFMSGQECQGLGFAVVIFLCFSFFSPQFLEVEGRFVLWEV